MNHTILFNLSPVFEFSEDYLRLNGQQENLLPLFFKIDAKIYRPLPLSLKNGGATPCLLYKFFLVLWSANLSFSDKETITELDEIFSVGTFVSISEMHDAGDRLRLIISGHRRFVKCCYYVFGCVFRVKGQLAPKACSPNDSPSKTVKNVFYFI